MAKSNTTSTTKPEFKKGDRVSFRLGPRSNADATGTVTAVENTGVGRGRGIYLTVKCDDGETRKARPGSCRAA